VPCWTRGLVAGRQEGDGHDDDEREKPTEDEGGPLPRPVLRGQDEDEGRQWDGLEGDRQPDEHEVKDHAASFLLDSVDAHS